MRTRCLLALLSISLASACFSNETRVLVRRMQQPGAPHDEALEEPQFMPVSQVKPGDDVFAGSWPPVHNVSLQAWTRVHKMQRHQAPADSPYAYTYIGSRHVELLVTEKHVMIVRDENRNPLMTVPANAVRVGYMLLNAAGYDDEILAVQRAAPMAEMYELVTHNGVVSVFDRVSGEQQLHWNASPHMGALVSTICEHYVIDQDHELHSDDPTWDHMA